MQRIVVAIDGSAGANRALDAAAQLAKATRAELVILTIGGTMSGEDLRRLASVEGDLTTALKAAANAILVRGQKRIRRLDIPAVRLQTGWGDPAQTIIDAVRRQKADMLVVGRRGRGRLSGLLLGSVSQKLATLTPCPVLVVP